MALDFVLINTESGQDHDVYNQLLKVPEIAEMRPLFGEFDLIAKLEAPSFDELGRIVVEKIRAVPGVTGNQNADGDQILMLARMASCEVD